MTSTILRRAAGAALILALGAITLVGALVGAIGFAAIFALGGWRSYESTLTGSPGTRTRSIVSRHAPAAEQVRGLSDSERLEDGPARRRDPRMYRRGDEARGAPSC